MGMQEYRNEQAKSGSSLLADAYAEAKDGRGLLLIVLARTN
jgi:hypothetical protein